MATMIAKHHVKNFDSWKPVFDAHEPMRNKFTGRNPHVYREHGDPNNVLLSVEFDSLEKAKEFTNSSELKEAMEKAGVIDIPSVFFVE